MLFILDIVEGPFCSVRHGLSLYPRKTLLEGGMFRNFLSVCFGDDDRF